METLIDSDVLRVSVARDGDSKYITLCFTGIGYAYGGLDIQGEEFRKSAKNGTSVFIIDKQRSWGNYLDFGQIKAIVDSLGPGHTVNAVGNSMGGFLAILASRYIEIANCIAIVPQFSVHKGVFPDESRWDKWVDKIANWKILDLGNCFNESTNYYILGGVGGADDKHYNMMPNKKNVHKIYFRNRKYIHNVSQILKDENLLYDVISDCFLGRTASEIVAARLSDPAHGAFAANP